MAPARLVLATLLLAVCASRPQPAAAAPPARAPEAPRLRAGVQSAPDGAGGVYLAWSDSPDGTPDVFLVRVSAGGTVAAGWPAGGVTVCAAPGEQRLSSVFADGANGALVVWEDGRASHDQLDLYAQRVDSTGAALWTAGGARLAADAGFYHTVCADGTGGLLAMWRVGEGDATDMVGNRLTASGANAAGWSAVGAPVCVAAQSQYELAVVSDGAGGGYFLWSDQRGGPSELYAQHLDSAGAAQWTADGISLASEPSGIEPLAACEDGAGGLIAVWSGGEGRIAQRFDAAGATQWTPGGVVVEAGSGTYQMTLLPTGSGGVLAAWNVFVGSDMELRAQRLSGTGAVQWAAEGVVLRGSAAGGGVFGVRCAGDGLGGAVVTWTDGRGGPGDWWPTYSQRVDAAGAVHWPADGRMIAAPGARTDGFETTPDGAGGALFAWTDYDGYVAVVRAQRLATDGSPQWAAGGVTITTGASATQLGGFTAHDGANGAWLVWVEVLGTGQQVRARRLGPTGAPLSETVPLSDATGDKYVLDVAPGVAGGLFVGWSRFVGGSDAGVYAQHVDGAGAPTWTAGGVVVTAAGAYHYNPRMIADGTGGVMFAWSRYATDMDVVAQRVDATGALRWGATGTVVCGLTGHQYSGALVADGTGGMICAWSDRGAPAGVGLAAQRLDADGLARWAADGVPLALPDVNDADPVAMVTDGANGAIVLVDCSYRVDPASDDFVDSLRVQRLSATGTRLWGASGTTVLALGTRAEGTRLVPDGLAGAVVAWEEERTTQQDLYAQRVDGAGAVQWTANGAPLCVAADWQELAGVAGDGAGGVFASWADARSHGHYDLYVQRLLANGSPAWTADGIVVSGAARGQYGGGLALDATGGVIVGWTDNSAGTSRSVRAQRVQSDGAVRWAVDGVTSVSVSLASATLESGVARLAWRVSTEAKVRIERATESSAWTLVGERLPDGDGLVRFDDASVGDGVRYGYRLVVPDASGAVIAGEVWLGSRLVLALESPRPNPVPRDFALAFTLPTAAPARLELFDVRGRRVAARDVGALGAGRHTVRFEDRREPGVYFARLTQGDATRRTRVVVVE